MARVVRARRFFPLTRVAPMPPPPPEPPDLTAARPERKPSVWRPQPIPTRGRGRSTEDPKTPTRKELAARAARAPVTAAPGMAAPPATRPDATRVAARPGAPAGAPAPTRTPLDVLRSVRVETALDRDPLGRDRLTAAERQRLGDLCRVGDCGKVQVYRGNGTSTANALWADVTKASGGRSVTLGNRIFLAPADRNNFAVLAHEVHHTTQYQRWGAVGYYTRGLGERINELRGNDPYRYVPDGRRFDQYGMEQQGQIVQDYADRKAGALRIPGVPRVGP